MDLSRTWVRLSEKTLHLQSYLQQKLRHMEVKESGSLAWSPMLNHDGHKLVWLPGLLFTDSHRSERLLFLLSFSSPRPDSSHIFDLGPWTSLL